jgi:hypothetical protein
LTCDFTVTNLFHPFGAQGRIKWDGVGVGHSPSATPSQKNESPLGSAPNFGTPNGLCCRRFVT